MYTLEIDQIFQGIKFLTQISKFLFEIVKLLPELHRQMRGKVFLKFVKHGLYLLWHKLVSLQQVLLAFLINLLLNLVQLIVLNFLINEPELLIPPLLEILLQFKCLLEILK